MTDTRSAVTKPGEEPEQLPLLPSSDAHARFLLSRETRERGLRHVAEIRRRLTDHHDAA